MVRPKPERIQLPEADDDGTGIIYGHSDHSQSSAGPSVNFVRATDAGPNFTKEEWEQRLQTRIEPGLPRLGETPLETQLRDKIAKLEARIAELEGKRK